MLSILTYHLVESIVSDIHDFTKESPRSICVAIKTMVQGVQIVDGAIVCVDRSTGAAFDRVRVSTPAEIDAAVSSAKAAQPAWEAVDLDRRVSILKAAVKGLAEQHGVESLARLVTREMGKVLSEAMAEVEGAVDKDAMLNLVRAANEPEPVAGGSVVYRDAHGVVGLCTPWNVRPSRRPRRGLPTVHRPPCTASGAWSSELLHMRDDDQK